MDPDALLNRIFLLLSQRDWEECFSACISLQKHLRETGDAPAGYIPKELAGFVKCLKHRCKMESQPTLYQEQLHA